MRLILILRGDEMTDDNRGSPPVNRDFEASSAAREPVSRAEADALEKERPAPKVERHHRPGGTVEQTVHQNLSADKAARISQIKQQLSRAREEKKTRETFNDRST